MLQLGERLLGEKELAWDKRVSIVACSLDDEPALPRDFIGQVCQRTRQYTVLRNHPHSTNSRR